MINFQPLRIPSGWTIEWNTFMEVDPHPDDMTNFSGSSLLHAYNRHYLRALNLEWAPEEDFEGEFYLRVINLVEVFNPKTKEFDLVGDWQDPHYEFGTRERLEIVSEIERLMQQLTYYEDPRILQSRGVVHEKAEELRLKLQDKGISDALVSEIVNTQSKQLHILLIEHPGVQKHHLESLVKHGKFKKIGKRASQKLNSKAFRGI